MSSNQINIWTGSRLNSLFHGLQGMRGVVSVSNITENEWMDFQDFFLLLVVYNTMNHLEHLGVLHKTPWIQVLFVCFLDQCLSGRFMLQNQRSRRLLVTTDSEWYFHQQLSHLSSRKRTLEWSDLKQFILCQFHIKQRVYMGLRACGPAHNVNINLNKLIRYCSITATS